MFLLRSAVFLLVFTALAEVWLRTVTPASEVPLGFEDPGSRIVRFDRSGQPQGLFTVGRLARRGGEWRINNAGWNSAVDYAPSASRDRPLIALFGDSYIEGFLSDADKHVDAYLSRMLKPATDVYAFGHSGWYLEQYVATSRYAASRFQPDLLVIFIGGDDVTASIREAGVVSPYLWQVSDVGGRFVEVPPVAIYNPSGKMRLSRHSAIVRYLRYNAALVLPGMQNAAIPQPAASAGPTGSADAWRGLLPAADFMVGRLCADHPDTPIVFVSYNQRYLPVAAVGRTPSFPDALAVQAASKGRSQCHFLDLDRAFSVDWATNHRRFEAADGGHWNAYANRLVARAVAAFLVSHGLINAAP
jgi:GDSL-like Lipase/Acylhydrolase family